MSNSSRMIGRSPAHPGEPAGAQSPSWHRLTSRDSNSACIMRINACHSHDLKMARGAEAAPMLGPRDVLRPRTTDMLRGPLSPWMVDGECTGRLRYLHVERDDREDVYVVHEGRPVHGTGSLKLAPRVLACAASPLLVCIPACSIRRGSSDALCRSAHQKS